jgi:hypothetical protein
MQKKKLEVPVNLNEVKEHEGFVLGETVYCLRYPDKQASRGEISQIHLGEPVGPYITYSCEATGQFRKALLSETYKEPPVKVKSDAEKFIAKSLRKDQAHALKLKEKEKEKGK